MNKNDAIELLGKYLDEVPQLKKLPYDNEDYQLWLSKAKTVIEKGLEADDLAAFCSYRGSHVRGWFPPEVYQEDYLAQLQDYVTALKAIIQKYGIIEQTKNESPNEFSNKTIGCIVEVLSRRTDSELRTFFLKYGLVDTYEQSGRLTAKQRKVSDVFQHLVRNQDNKVIKNLIRHAIKDLYTELEKRSGGWKELFPQNFQELNQSLISDRYNVFSGELIPTITPVVDSCEEEGLLDKLLTKYELQVAKNHLKQAYDNYNSGNWESANAALRSFLQEVFDAIALVLNPVDAATIEPGGKRRQLLQSMGVIDGDAEADLIKGFFTFASANGSHPGISNESDSRLRRYMAVAIASYYLEKLESINEKTV